MFTLPPSEQDPVRLSRRKCIKLKLSAKDGIALMQDALEDQTNITGVRGKGGRATLQRQTGTSMLQNHFPKQQRHFTARIVVLGDDRVVGRLAKAYYHYRYNSWDHKTLPTELKLVCFWTATGYND